MPVQARTAIIIPASSDIGTAMADHWLDKGWTVAGTYRTRSAAVDRLGQRGVHMTACDFLEPASITRAAESLRNTCPAWDVLVLAAGTLNPVGPFGSGDFDEWERSVRVNFTSQVCVVREFLPTRRLGAHLAPCVLFFAGGGTNNATVNQSAYTVSKIALIKMCELLDAEISDVRFAIVGPGWVRTKIHAGAPRKTVEVPMSEVLRCFDWLVDAPRDVMSGRNFSAAFDKWGTAALEERLRATPDMYKLRRSGNDWTG